MDNLQWLLENGGPAIQLRLSALNNLNAEDTENAVSELLSIDGVRAIFDYYDGFKTTDRDLKTFEHLIHYYKETCMETFFPYIMDFGFKAGIAVFDEKMKSVADMFKYAYSMSHEQSYYNISLMFHRYFLTTSYLFPELEESMERRLDALHTAAKEKSLDIFQDEAGLPKKPPIWENYKVMKDDTNPWKISAKKPLPMWFDIWSLAYYAEHCTDTEKLKKINDILAYILDPDFQKMLDDDCDILLYVKERRIYHVSGFGLILPLYEIGKCISRTTSGGMLDTLGFMSCSEMVRQSKWFVNTLYYFEQFKTEKGTYLFPKEYLHKKYIDKAFLSERNMTLKRNEREIIKREVVSTMKMAEIYGRI